MRTKVCAGVREQKIFTTNKTDFRGAPPLRGGASRTAGRRKLAGQGGWPKFPEHAVALPTTTSVPKHLLFGSMQRSALQSKQRNCSFLGMRVRKQKYGGAQGTQPEKTGECSEPMRGTASPRSAQAKSPACDHPSLKKVLRRSEVRFFSSSNSREFVSSASNTLRCQVLRAGKDSRSAHGWKPLKKQNTFSANGRTPPSS